MIFNVERFILLSSSAVSAGLVISAVDDLKLILLDRILRERGNDTKMLSYKVILRQKTILVFRIRCDFY